MRNEPLDIHLHDTTISAQQNDPWDESFRTEVYGGLIRELRFRGWSVREDPRIKQHYSVLNRDHRLIEKGTLRGAIEKAGRSCRVEFWSSKAKQGNPNGRRHDFNKFDRMPYLEQKRFLLESQRIINWLDTIAETTVTDRRTYAGRKRSAIEVIQAKYAESCHSDKKLGRPVCRDDYNRKSANGSLIEHGQTVWFRDRAGYLKRGQALYNINSMWWVVFGPKEYTNLSCWEIHTTCPALIRRDVGERRRRQRLEAELRKALQFGQYTRAALLDHLILGGESTYHIWSRKNDAYYGTQYSGYTSDRFHAGRYTRAEAEAECQRVPHILSMVCPDGSMVRFDKEAAA